ncbi:hypothetical protein DV735_g5317, partial [Chaetothyriales sp. CBS 134920]
MSAVSDDMDCIQGGPPGLSYTKPFPSATPTTIPAHDNKSGNTKEAEGGRSRVGDASSEQNTKSTSAGAEPEPTVIFIPPADDSSIAAHERFATYMDNVQSYIFTASQRLNDLTGYSNIQALKDSIAAQEAEVAEARTAVKTSRAKYAEAIKMRSETQREVNDLLHRKLSWTPEDVEKFTRLYRSDHANEQAEQTAQQAVTHAEQVFEEASTRLGRTILARYHEEQIWSDKIRQMSTWGTWGLMGINILLFIILQVLLEPWRRRRLVRGFEEKVEAALQHREHEWQLKKEEAEAAAAAAAAAVAALATEAAPAPAPTPAEAAPALATEESSPTTTTTTPATVEADAAAEAATLLCSSSQPPATAEAIVDHQTPALSETTVPEALLAVPDTGDSTVAAASAHPDTEEALPREPRDVVQTVVAAVTAAYARSEAAVYQLFSEQPRVVSQKALTTLALEAAATGAVVTG